MKKIVAILSLIWTITGFATETHYDQVKTMFEQATAPNLLDLEGFNVGRCFFRDKPTLTADGVIYGKVKYPIEGPIEEKKIFAIAIMGSRIHPVGAYDTSKNDSDFQNAETSQVRVTSDSLLIDKKVDDSREFITWEIRKKDSYLVYRLGSYAYCYTFIRR